jgi:hypothetical protein
LTPSPRTGAIGVGARLASSETRPQLGQLVERASIGCRARGKSHRQASSHQGPTATRANHEVLRYTSMANRWPDPSLLRPSGPDGRDWRPHSFPMMFSLGQAGRSRIAYCVAIG